jgi:hypothetical protein
MTLTLFELEAMLRLRDVYSDLLWNALLMGDIEQAPDWLAALEVAERACE